jgi:hypothetical protein
MESTDLFSHPNRPEPVRKSDSPSDPVQLPTFSDGNPQSNEAPQA